MQAEEAVRARLLEWYRENRRDLPWRRTRDPYAIWVSEVMLQQTRVETVIPYYERFLLRWPTVAHLAAADRDELRAAWSGLGYYRRLELMVEAAVSISRDHGGKLPREASELQALPGFGRYTAGAVASIAYDRPAPAVDGNVARVLARLYAIPGDVLTGPAQKAVWERASKLAPGEAPGELTQALIELGARVCIPRSPRCPACPLSDRCLARRDGLTDTLPEPRRRAAKKRVELSALLSLEDEGVLLERQPPGGLFASLWLLPMIPGALEGDALLNGAEAKLGCRLESIRFAGEVTHLLTHRELLIKIYSPRGAPRSVSLPLARVPLKTLSEHGVPSVTVRALKAALPKHLIAEASLPGRRPQRVEAAGQLAFDTQASTLALDRER